MIAPSLEGIPGKGSSPEPTIPAIHPASPPASQPVHAHTSPNQPIRSRNSLPARVFPVSKNTNQRVRTRSSLADLVCPCSQVCFASQPSNLFSFPFFFAISFLPAWLACSNFHSIRADCFTFTQAQLSLRARHDSSRPTLTHRIASRLSIRPPLSFARPTQ